MSVTRILVAGDNFIRPSLFRESLKRSVPGVLDIRELKLPWPDTPFGPVSEVEEASGTEEELIEALDGCAIVVTQLAPLTERVMEKSPCLKLAVVARGGPTNVNLDAAARHGVTVANYPGRNSIATAEMTIALSMALLRGIGPAHMSMVRGIWRSDLYSWDKVGHELADSTVGLLGLGAVGFRVAKAFRNMGANVLVYDPFVSDAKIGDLGNRATTVQSLFSNSRLVSVNARLTPETQDIVDSAAIGAMSPGGLLVSTARGGLVDYDAVAEAIESGQLGGAAFDVYRDEPADFGHSIFQLAGAGYNILLTPHVGGASEETAIRAARGAGDEVARFLAGRPLRHVLVGGTDLLETKL